MYEQGQHLESGPTSSQPGARPREEHQPDRQTTAFIAASRRSDRSTEAKRESAEKASKKFSEETGEPLLIDEAGEAIKPEEAK